MNHALKRISLAILAMFLLLLINTNYLQAFEATSLASKPYNGRALSESNQTERGNIETSDGVLVAGSKPSAKPGDFYKYQRYYTNGPTYAPVTGYDTLYSASGVEQAEDGLLSGSGQQLAFRNFIDMITNKAQKGATVQLTVNSKAQQAAYEGLQNVLQGTGHIGGVVALDPSTGKILAMASYPSYNPNVLATHNGNQLNKADKHLIGENPSPLTNNATESLLPPGSTFKIITSSAWFSQDSSRNPSSEVYSPQVLTLPQTSNTLHNDANEICGSAGTNGKTTIEYAFAQSCDTTFGDLGMTLGGSALSAMASKYGMNKQLNIPGATSATSSYVLPNSLPLTAFSAIGQYDDTVTPLQEAMLASAVANNGTLMKPYLVQKAIASDLSTVASTQPSVLSHPVSPKVASYLQQMMTAAVQQPEGTSYQYNAANEGGLEIAGKTGTAQNQLNGTSASPDAVYTAYAPANGTPKIAVGVMIQGGGYGATGAAPIAVNVIKAYLAAVGQG
ncbi:MAG: penicillin-binding protein 2 [Nocardiopsaceae bacterium]|nr:penicillin-binding protein 2 [Nocardiopsaceae bacterium]